MRILFINKAILSPDDAMKSLIGSGFLHWIKFKKTISHSCQIYRFGDTVSHCPA
jgi:hypothetical protein